MYSLDIVHLDCIQEPVGDEMARRRLREDDGGWRSLGGNTNLSFTIVLKMRILHEVLFI